MQSSGECDFIDEKTKKKYDAKLAFSQKQCQMICSKKRNLVQWTTSMLEELEMFYQRIRTNTFETEIENLSLYTIMKNEIQRDKPDEDIIFFIPFTIIKESSHTIFSQFSYDILSAIFEKINSENILGYRKLYVIYFGLDNEIVLRCLNTNQREYFSNDLFQNIIEFNVYKV